MLKSVVLLCVVFSVVIEARPKWQYLPAVPGYVPVYIRPGDTPLEDINPDLAEAFHVLPAGRSASKQIDASPEEPELAQGDQPISDIPFVSDETLDGLRAPEKSSLLKKTVDISNPVKQG